MSNKIKNSNLIKLDDECLLENNNGTTDMFVLLCDITKQLNIKIAILLFFIFVFINTDIYGKYILKKINSDFYNTETDNFNEKGIYFSGMILVIFYIIIDFLNNNKCI